MTDKLIAGALRALDEARDEIASAGRGLTLALNRQEVTAAAWAKFQRGAPGLVADGMPGAKTAAAALALQVKHEMLAHMGDGLQPATDLTPWLTFARSKIGEKEIPGQAANPFIVECLESTRLGRKHSQSDETAWCSGFVNLCMEQAGIEGTDSARARSWLGWGIELSAPRVGCVVVFSRGKPWQGHVALVNAVDGQGSTFPLAVLGGNQSNSVNVTMRDEEQVLSYRWPEGWPQE